MELLDVKGILGINLSDTSKDDYIEFILPLIIEFVQDYCGETFEDPQQPGLYTFRGGLKVTIAKMIQFHMNKSGIQSEGISRRSVAYNTEYPKYITDALDMYKSSGGIGGSGLMFF